MEAAVRLRLAAGELRCRSCLAVFSIIEMVILGPIVLGSVVITIVNHFESKKRIK